MKITLFGLLCLAFLCSCSLLTPAGAQAAGDAAGAATGNPAVGASVSTLLTWIGQLFGVTDPAAQIAITSGVYGVAAANPAKRIAGAALNRSKAAVTAATKTPA